MTHRDGMIGILVAFAIGVLIRFLRLPIPAPPTIYGGLMIVAMTCGFLLVDSYLKK